MRVMQIWKFPVPLQDEFEIGMPEGASVVKVGQQNGSGRLWACVVPAAPVERRRFWVRGTGHDIDPGASYLGTFSTPDNLVWHVFEWPR